MTDGLRVEAAASIATRNRLLPMRRLWGIAYDVQASVQARTSVCGEFSGSHGLRAQAPKTSLL
uniref:Uncharacterized protein n=1 Tax=Setaria italica TaxID=4555 RepID=K3YBI5_SETIT